MTFRVPLRVPLPAREMAEYTRRVSSADVEMAYPLPVAVVLHGRGDRPAAACRGDRGRSGHYRHRQCCDHHKTESDAQYSLTQLRAIQWPHRYSLNPTYTCLVACYG